MRIRYCFSLLGCVICIVGAGGWLAIDVHHRTHSRVQPVEQLDFFVPFPETRRCSYGAELVGALILFEVLTALFLHFKSGETCVACWPLSSQLLAQ